MFWSPVILLICVARQVGLSGGYVFPSFYKVLMYFIISGDSELSTEGGQANSSSREEEKFNRKGDEVSVNNLCICRFLYIEKYTAFKSNSLFTDESLIKK